MIKHNNFKHHPQDKAEAKILYFIMIFFDRAHLVLRIPALWHSAKGLYLEIIARLFRRNYIFNQHDLKSNKKKENEK